MAFVLIIINSVTQFFLSYLQDIIGRRSVSWILCSLMIVLNTVMFFIPNYIIKMVLLGILVGTV